MFELFVTVVLAIHLLSVNVGAAAPLLCMWFRYREISGGDQTIGVLGRKVARASAGVLWLGILLGFAVLGMLYWQRDEGYFQAFARLPARRYWFALAELGFSLACLTAYGALWDRLRNWPKAHALLALLASTNILYHFPPLLAIVSVLSTRPHDPGVVLDSAAYRALLVDPEVASRVAHVWLASFAVAGVFAMLVATRDQRQNELSSGAIRSAMFGARVALGATLLQLVVGLILLFALPPTAKFALMGKDGLASALFMTAVLASLLLMHLLAAIAQGEVRPKAVWRSAWLMVLIVMLMTGTLRRVRQLATPVPLATHGSNLSLAQWEGQHLRLKMLPWMTQSRG